MAATLSQGWQEAFHTQGYLVLPSFFELSIIQNARHARNQLVDRYAEQLLAAGQIQNDWRSEPFHRGLPNYSSKIRWSVDWRYQDATQPTLRKENGHIARSRREPTQAVQNADHWASLYFG